MNSAASTEEESKKNEPKQSIREQLFMLVKNRNYMILLFLDTCQLVLISCVAGNISLIMNINNITNTVFSHSIECV